MVVDRKELRKEIYMQVLPNLIWGKPLNHRQEISFKIWKKEFDIDEDYLRFYLNKNVLFEITKYLGNKELCLNNNIRWLYASKIDYILKTFYVYNFFENPKTMYCGLAGFSRRDAPPINPVEKKEWQNNYWTSEENPAYLEKMNSYDFGIDLDADTFEESYKDAVKLFEFFVKYKIKFSVWNSGKKGWHFKIPYEEFSNLLGKFDVENCVVFCKSLALDLKNKLKLKKIDMIIYSATRFLKCPFSIDPRNKRIILPLDNKEFINFKTDYLDMDYCLKKKNLGFIDPYMNRKSNKSGFTKMVEVL